MRRQLKKRLSLMALTFVLFFGSATAAANEGEFQNFTFSEKDVHKPIFVVLLDDDNTSMVHGEAAIYRIFFGNVSTDDSTNPVLNLWTDDKGSKRVQR